MKVSDMIRSRLQSAFSPEALDILDESEKHRGHSGWNAEGESHFHVTIRSPRFGPMSRIERHRAIHAALGPDLTARIHALGLTVSG